MAFPATEEDPDDISDPPPLLLIEGFFGGFSSGRGKEGVLVLLELGLEFVLDLEFELR